MPPIFWTTQTIEESPGVVAQYPTWGLQAGYSMTGAAFTVPGINQQFEVNVAGITAWLNAFVPDVNTDAIIVIDDETNAWRIIRDFGTTNQPAAFPSLGYPFPSAQAAYDAGVAKFTAMFNQVKAERPNCICGFFASIPTFAGSPPTPLFLQQVANFTPITHLTDAHFPQVYPVYPLSYLDIDTTIEVMIEVGLGKPVFPFIHHRWRTLYAPDPFGLLPDDELFNHVQHLIVNTSFNGVKPDGVVSWGAELFSYNTAFDMTPPIGACGFTNCGFPWPEIRDAYNSELMEGETIFQYLDRLKPALYEIYSSALGLMGELPVRLKFDVALG